MFAYLKFCFGDLIGASTRRGNMTVSWAALQSPVDLTTSLDKPERNIEKAKKTLEVCE